MSDEISAREPLDPDTGPRRHLRPAFLVAVGGAVGTTARYMLSQLIPDLAGLPLGILVINLLGAFLLGCLTEILARLGPDTGVKQSLRLLLGTGAIGGFTTYSALSAGTAVLLKDGIPTTAVLYALGTLLFGAATTFAGIALGRTLVRNRESA